MGHHQKKLKLKRELDDLKASWRNDFVTLTEYQNAAKSIEARMALQKLIEVVESWRKSK